MTMPSSHPRWIDRLSEYLDGGLSRDAEASVLEHLESCEACARVYEELGEVRRRARALGDVQPPRDLWPEIHGALVDRRRGARVIRFPGRTSVTRRGVTLTTSQLAAASVVLVLASASLTLLAGRTVAPGSAGDPVAALPGGFVSSELAPPAEMAGELELLERGLAELRGELDPRTVRIIERNLAVIDRAITDSHRALLADPGNAFLRRYIERVFMRKLTYLREASSIAQWSG